MRLHEEHSGQVIAWGTNCIAPRKATPFLQSISKQEIGKFIPLIVYPNSGEKFSKETSTWTANDDFYPPEEFVKVWLDLGVRFIGGCCRTSIADVQRFSAEVEKWKKANRT